MIGWWNDGIKKWYNVVWMEWWLKIAVSGSNDSKGWKCLEMARNGNEWNDGMMKFLNKRMLKGWKDGWKLIEVTMSQMM